MRAATLVRIAFVATLWGHAGAMAGASPAIMLAPGRPVVPVSKSACPEIHGSERAALLSQVEWLKKHPHAHVRVEGHGDESGTREYSLALGARRAYAIKQYFINMGIDASRISTISYGKERPVCLEPAISCWERNRHTVTAVIREVACRACVGVSRMHRSQAMRAPAEASVPAFIPETPRRHVATASQE